MSSFWGWWHKRNKERAVLEYYDDVSLGHPGWKYWFLTIVEHLYPNTCTIFEKSESIALLLSDTSRTELYKASPPLRTHIESETLSSAQLWLPRQRKSDVPSVSGYGGLVPMTFFLYSLTTLSLISLPHNLSFCPQCENMHHCELEDEVEVWWWLHESWLVHLSHFSILSFFVCALDLHIIRTDLLWDCACLVFSVFLSFKVCYHCPPGVTLKSVFRQCIL